MGRIIEYFARRHILSSFMLLAVLLGGYFLWFNTNKEEMPDFTFNRVTISVAYPGATSEEAEYFIILPLEEALRGISGIEEITSNAAAGRGVVNVYLQKNIPDMNEAVNDIRTAVMDVKLPEEITELPSIRQFKSSSKAIIDIAVYNAETHLLTSKQRSEVQAIMLELENQLMALPQIVRVNRDAFRQEEIQIHADPKKLRKYKIPLNSLNKQIRSYNQRKPAGSMADAKESKVTLAAGLTKVSQIKPLIIQGGFMGPVVKVSDVAKVKRSYQESRGYLKVNGHEAVIMNAVKSSAAGIIVSVDAVKKVVEKFNATSLQDSPIQVVLLDDESINVRNRLDLISKNGVIGLGMIIVLLFIFLNPQSGFWVAFGIPFCFAFTMIGIHLIGFTINNMTLAAVIIVMGMVVDDAIVIAENITRLKHSGVDSLKASIEGARFVSKPVIAAVLTTCIAFIPLYFIEARFAALIQVIPPIIILMLLASLIESLLILPGHMSYKPPRAVLWVISLGTLPLWERAEAPNKKHWFDYVEDFYGSILYYALKGKILIFLGAALLIFMAYSLFSSEMKFVLFPNEETTQIRLKLEAPPQYTSKQTAELCQQVDSILTPYLNNEIVGFRTQIALSHWGRITHENKASMWIEIVSADNREKSAKQLMKEWKTALGDSTGFKKVKFSTSRFGQSSGSSVEILISENDNSMRNTVADSLAQLLKTIPYLNTVEIDRPLQTPEYSIDLKRTTLFRLGIVPSEVGNTLRTILEGTRLFDFVEGNEEVHVVLTANDDAKRSMKSLLTIPVENRGNYLVPLSEVVSVKKTVSQSSIQRENFKRITRVVADIKPDSPMTPLEIALELERDIFPIIQKHSPTTSLSFDGEIKDSRDSRGTFNLALMVVPGLIFALLALLFNSFVKPFVIMIAIPFAMVGVVYAFHWHGMHQYGFFAMVGVLGLMGVVINDSIVMLVKLTYETGLGIKDRIDRHVANIAKTRLRAVLLTTLTTVAGLFPTAYGVAGYDAMLAEMMLAMGWGLLFGSLITLLLVPAIYGAGLQVHSIFTKGKNNNGEKNVSH